MSTGNQKSKVSPLEFIATFLVLFFVVNAALKYFFPQQFGGQQASPVVTLSAQSSSFSQGNDPIIIIRNDTDQDLPLPKRCPQPPFFVAYIAYTSDGSEDRSDLMANQSVLPCVELTFVKAHTSLAVSMAGWKYALFQRTGTYEASIDLPAKFVGHGTGSHLATSFSMVEPGVFTKIFRTFVTKPLFNSLVFIASYMPGHNLGLAILVLTILVKLLLLVPNQHALEGQKKLQQLQPRLDELKKKYPGDAKRVQEETMRIWKEMKINPLQSCLPTLLQFPILIGLFFVIKNGVSIETSQHLLYSFYNHLPSPFFSYTFAGLDLLKPNIFLFPPLLILLQFLQMKMMMKKKQKPKDEIAPKPAGKGSWIPELDQQTIMTYALPLMIGFFALKFPSAVSLYWAVSTLFSIGQQAYVMKEKTRVTTA